MTNGNLGNAASGFVDAMKSQPLALAMVVMNLGLLGFLYYSGVQAASERHDEMQLLYQNRSDVAKLLYSCAPHDGGRQGETTK